VATIKEMWDRKDAYTKSASEISRTLCLSGLAVVWIFRVSAGQGRSGLPATLIWIAGVFMVAMFLDLIQYVAGTRRITTFAREKEAETIEKSLPASTSFDYPDALPGLMNRLWAVKIFLTIATWVVLLIYVFGRALDASLPALGD
jgi:hypothetical protein